MSLIKFDNRRFPWFNETLPSWLDTNDLFSDDFFVSRRNSPAVNIKENEKDFQLELAVPGFSKKEIKITMEDGYLEIEAEKKDEKEEDDNGYTRKEFSFNSFERSFKLPNNIDESKSIKANYSDGILKLNLDKKQEAPSKPKKVIEIA